MVKNTIYLNFGGDPKKSGMITSRYSQIIVHELYSFLFLGSKEGMMKNLFSGRKEAFYRFATMLLIPDITEQEWIPYITRKFTSRNIQTDETVIKEIIRLS